MSDEGAVTSRSNSKQEIERREILRRKADALSERERAELLAEIDRKLREVDGTDSPLRRDR
jgi:hypothetical protein